MFHTNIIQLTLQNNDFKKLINYSDNYQLILMSIPPKQSIPLEIHSKEDQLIFIVQGSATSFIGKNKEESILLNQQDFISIPKNTWHTIYNHTDNVLKLYTIYTPPDSHNDQYKNKYLKYKLKYINTKKNL